MFSVVNCIATQHDLRLVVFAMMICLAASTCAFLYNARALQGVGGFRLAWIALAALVAGSGVWATHFMAMLAYQPSLAIRYELAGTLTSLGIAVATAAVGFGLPAWRRGHLTELGGGAVVGAGIALTHYTGMSALRMQDLVIFDRPLVLASVAVSIAGGMAAFGVRRHVKGSWRWIGPSALLVLAISGLHFTGMGAVTLTPDLSHAAPTELVSRGTLAAATAGLAAFILLAGLGLMSAEHLGQENNLSGLRRALDAMPSALVFADHHGRVRVWNWAFTRLMADCGLTPRVGMDRMACLVPAIQAGWFGPFDLDDPRWMAEHQAKVRAGATEWRLPDGRWIELEIRPTRDGGSVTVVNDITANKTAVATMAESKNAAEAASRAKTEFLTNVSHEIRTPLNGVLGIADVLLRGQMTPEQQRLIKIILESGRLLDGQLTDLLEMARAEAGAAGLHLGVAKISDMVRFVTDLHASRADIKGLNLRANVSPEADTEVICDARKVRQTLGNLVANAVKFTNAGDITIAVTRRGERVRFEVRDTGIGFDPTHKDKLFERFQQGDASMTRQYGGVGLGLAICKEHVGLMDGAFDCDSTPGEGSMFAFEVNLPAVGVSATVEEDAASEGDHHPFRVLVVDDNAVNRQVLELILDSVALEHSSVENGAESVEAFMTGGFDAVLMDIQMPVMDGLEATRRIRAWEAACGRSRTPIIIVSANCLKEHVEAGREAGADAHLDKPISAAALIGAISTYAEEAIQVAA